MSRALHIYYTAFDNVFLDLPGEVRRRIEAALDDMGEHLGSYPHYRMTGGNRYRLRVGDYRITIPSTSPRTKSTCSPLALAAKFIGDKLCTLSVEADSIISVD